MNQDERRPPIWRSRLRWRLRASAQWPAFALFVACETVLLHHLPLSGDGTGYVPAFLLSGLLAVGVLAVFGRLAGRAVRRRRPDLPLVVARDRAGTALIAALAAALLAAGLIHRPAVQAHERAFAAQSTAVRAWVAHHAPAPYRARIDAADTWMLKDDYYRTCVPGPDPTRALCLLVSTDVTPPGIRRDSDGTPNSRYSGPDAPGRKRG